MKTKRRLSFNLPEIIYKYVDKVLIRIVYLVVPEDVILRRLKKEADHWGDEDLVDYFLKILNTLHGRASSMISHLSIMLAICTYLLKQDNFSAFMRHLVLFDAVVYLILVLLSIRSLRSIGLDADYGIRSAYIKHLEKELTLKYTLIQIINSFTIVATIVLVVTLVIFGFSDPPPKTQCPA